MEDNIISWQHIVAVYCGKNNCWFPSIKIDANAKYGETNKNMVTIWWWDFLVEGSNRTSWNENPSYGKLRKQMPSVE